jgi:UDP-N-acetylmuramoyl-tripeptide--D-alanyl-D-alanine ligase
MWPWSSKRVLIALNAECLIADAMGNDANLPGQTPSVSITGTSTDSRKIFEGCLFVAIKGENFDGHDHIKSAFEKGASYCLGNRKWAGWHLLPKHFQARCFLSDDVLNSFRSLAKAMRQTFSFPVIGIGGSNGKTTTKEFLKAMLSKVADDSFVAATDKSENGFLGVAITLTKPELRSSNPPAALILEIGIDETGAMQQHVDIASPDVVLLTALGPEHLSGLGTWENAIEEEFRLFSGSPSAVKIWQGNDAALNQRRHLAQKSVDVWVERRDPEREGSTHSTENISKKDSQGMVVLENKLSWKCLLKEREFTEIEVDFQAGLVPKSTWQLQKAPPISFQQEVFKVPLPGIHNAENFALALGVSVSLGLSPATIRAGLQHFVPPAMRSKVEAFDRNNTLFMDCYNSSPSSLSAAISLMKTQEWSGQSKIFILGDMLDLGSESNIWHMKIPDLLQGILGLRLCLVGNAMYDVSQTLKTSFFWNSTGKGPVGPQLSWFEKASEVNLDLVLGQAEVQDCVVLVKGSRGVGLEVLEEPLRRRFFRQTDASKV